MKTAVFTNAVSIGVTDCIQHHHGYPAADSCGGRFPSLTEETQSIVEGGSLETVSILEEREISALPSELR